MRKERKIINTNIRLNLLEESDRKAWEHLQNMDRKEYKSYSRAVVAALNDYFDRKEKLEEDPYLETREKEDAFLDSLLSKFEKQLENAVPLMIAEHMFQLLQHMPRGVDSENTGKWDYEKENDNLQANQAQEMQKQQEIEEAEDAALDFADSF